MTKLRASTTSETIQYRWVEVLDGFSTPLKYKQSNNFVEAILKLEKSEAGEKKLG